MTTKERLEALISGNEDGVAGLAELGFVDFAGSTVVHGIGGWSALAVVLGRNMLNLETEAAAAPGDTIRVSLTPEPGGDRDDTVRRFQRRGRLRSDKTADHRAVRRPVPGRNQTPIQPA